MTRSAVADCVLLVGLAVVYGTMRFPRRLVFRSSAFLLGAAMAVVTIIEWQHAISPPNLVWGIVGALSAIGILGSTLLAMILGHWYLVVRGMSIDPLKRLAHACLGGAAFRLVIVVAALATIAGTGLDRGTPLHAVLISDGVFFWMRAGWGLIVPLLLYPMIWGTVRIRSTMAATGILYVAVVAVVIGEVLGTYLSARHGLPI